MVRKIFCTERKSILIFTTPLQCGEVWFGYKVPEVDEGNVFIDKIEKFECLKKIF